MKRINRLLLVLLSSILFIPGIGFSGEAATEITTEITPVTEGNISYIGGGIGAGQAQAMKNLRKDFNLLLTFALKGSGEYLADINVSIQNAKGKQILETVSPGPLFYAKLPQGKYKVSAEYGGKVLIKSTDIKKGSVARDLYFYWDKESGNGSAKETEMEQQ